MELKMEIQKVLLQETEKFLEDLVAYSEKVGGVDYTEWSKLWKESRAGKLENELQSLGVDCIPIHVITEELSEKVKIKEV